MGNECLIIGSSSFLGSHLASVLAAAGVSFDTVDRDPENSRSVEGRKRFRLDGLDQLAEDYASVFLIAAAIPADKSAFTKALYQANIQLPGLVAEKFENSTLVYASSIAVYGTPSSELLTETSPFQSPDAYGSSKLAGEFALQQHPDYRILRFSSLYGEGMAPSTFVPKIIDDALYRRKITLFGDGSRIQNYLHVNDAAHMMHTAANEATSGSFNAVANRSYSNLEVAKAICDLIPATKIETSGLDHSPSFNIDGSLWSQTFSYHPSTPLENGLRKMISNA